MEETRYWTEAKRKSIVTKTFVRALNDGDALFPDPDKLTAPSDSWLRTAIEKRETIWLLHVYYQTGFDQEQAFRQMHGTKEAALKAQERLPKNAEIDPLFFIRATSREFDPENLSMETELSIFGRGEVPYSLIYRALEGAGVIDSSYNTSERVLSWVGRAGRDILEARFGENWEAVAQLEYCVKHFSPTSLATLAARVQVSDFISNKNFDAGYASRELEMLVGGAEDIASKSQQVRKRAGAEGGKASRARRMRNLNLLIEEIEALSGVVGVMSEERVVDQAFESVRGKNPNFPRTSKTRFDYETTLRSEEPFKTRYYAVFRRNA